MLAQYLDLTLQAQSEGFVEFETSNYDGTLNSGAVQGVTDGSIYTSDNYVPITAVDLYSGNYTSSCDGTNGIFRFDVVSRYININPISDATKVLVMLAKIS